MLASTVPLVSLAASDRLVSVVAFVPVAALSSVVILMSVVALAPGHAVVIFASVVTAVPLPSVGTTASVVASDAFVTVAPEVELASDVEAASALVADVAKGAVAFASSAVTFGEVT